VSAARRSGKTAVITGASQGIGRAAAVRLSQEPGVTGLALIARSASGLEQTVECMNHDGKEIICLPYDLADLDGIPELIAGIRRHFGGIDLLLNVAGYADPQSLLDTSNENLVRTYTVNVFAMTVLIRETVRHMRRRPGKILNVASTAGISARPGWLAYASSKAAVVSLSMTLSEELAGTGIKVYTISPGRCATELRRLLAPEEDQSTIMQPSQVAEVIAKLMDDAETTLDGQNIIVRQQA
jgi:3-oxoacyl-[acyl-carrier protein] reductase